MALGYIDGDVFGDIADAIREKSGTSEAFTPAQMASAIIDLPSGGEGMIAPSAYQSSTITSISSNATGILDGAFESCLSLTTVSFPVCSYIGNYAFQVCSSLTTVSFPVCSYIGNSAFEYCKGLTTAFFPGCSYIGTCAFYCCSSLTTVSFPVCSYIGSYTFKSCSSLTTVSFPVCSYIGSNAFYSCSKLTTVSFPVCSYIGSCAFFSCSRLTTVLLGNSTLSTSNKILYSTFFKCYNLTSLTLAYKSMIGLSNSTAFTSTPIAGYTTYAGKYGSIYVPTSLLTSYKTATNWSYFSSRFVGY